MFKHCLCATIAFCLFLSPAWSQEEVKKCPRCNYVEKRPSANFCIHCGEKLTTYKTVMVLVCPTCQKTLDKGGEFCAFCGTKGKAVYQEIPEVGYEPSKEIFDKTRPPRPDSPEKSTEKPSDFSKQGKMKDNLLLPGFDLIKKESIDEGLRITSRQRKMEYALYSSVIPFLDIENFYRAHPMQFKWMKITDDVLNVPVCFWKAKNDQAQIEVITYAFAPENETDFEERHKRITQKLEEEMRPLKTYEKEIEQIEKLIAEGKVRRDSVQDRIEDLKNRQAIGSNSRTYLQLLARDQMCRLKKNIILLLVTRLNGAPSK